LKVGHGLSVLEIVGTGEEEEFTTEGNSEVHGGHGRKKGVLFDRFSLIKMNLEVFLQPVAADDTNS